MPPRLVLISGGLLSALLIGAFLSLILFELHPLDTTGEVSLLSLFDTSLLHAFVYGLPLAILAVIATEIVRIRHVAAQIAIGTVLTFVAAYFVTLGDALTSSAFSGGTLSSVCLTVIGILSSLAYWGIAGRQAGWRGDAIERADRTVADAFRNASANTQVEYCWECVLGWCSIGILLFLVVTWISVEASGLRASLIEEAEVQGNAALEEAGYAWAKFKVNGDRGVIEGLAPDELQKRAAYDSVRVALESVTGFPGIVAQIEDKALAHIPKAAVSQKLADAARRENEAKAAVEAARVAMQNARVVEEEAKRKAEEQVRAAEAEMKRRLAEQARADDEARQKAATAPATPVEVAAVGPAAREEPGPGLHTEPPAESAAGSPALPAARQPQANTCTEQDLAVIETSAILFDMQRFDIPSSYDLELGRLATSARACAPRPVLVTGYADSDGDSLFNRALRLQRAENARQTLIAHGIPSTLVVARASGSTSGNSAADGDRAWNRRVDFKVLEVAETSRDATLGPDERAATCESDLSEIMAQSIIHFAMGSAQVGEENMGLIKKLAGSIQTCGSVIVTVEGHTDKVGTSSVNQGLSEARAKAVREALVAAGADPTRLASRGFASTRPYDPADTAAAYALNRRIEFRVSGKFTSSATGGP